MSVTGWMWCCISKSTSIFMFDLVPLFQYTIESDEIVFDILDSTPTITSKQVPIHSIKSIVLMCLFHKCRCTENSSLTVTFYAIQNWTAGKSAAYTMQNVSGQNGAGLSGDDSEYE